MGRSATWSATGYLDDLSKSVSNKSKTILFANDKSFIIDNCNKDRFKLNTNEIFNEINKCFCSNLLTLNYGKTYFVQFVTKTNYKIKMQISFGDRKIATARNFNYLGLINDSTLTWKHHISELTARLNEACYAIRSIKPFMSLYVLRSMYFIMPIQLYPMELYFGGTLHIVKKYIKFTTE